MSLLDFLTGKTECPNCGTKGARKSGDQIRCPNPHCSNFDPSLQGTEPARPAAAFAGRGNFIPGRPISIRYRNYKGEERTFTADAASAAKKRNHITICVAPTGKRIALSRDRIQNLAEVEQACR